MKWFFRNYLENNLFFWIFGLISIALIITSFFLPPTGVVEPSVMAAVGEIFAFTSLGTVLKAISANKTATISKGDINVTIGDKKED